MTEIERARTQLLALGPRPGVTELTMILSNIELDVAVGHEALIRLLQSDGGLSELRNALMTLRSTLESLRDKYREYETSTEHMYWDRTAPGLAAELVLRPVRSRLRAIDDLIWDLPSQRRRRIEG